MNKRNKAECPENEKWQKFKKEFWGEKLLATTEWGLIDFDLQGKDDMVGGDTLSYDEYLDLQMQSGKKQEHTLRYAITMLISFPLKEELSVSIRRNSFCVSKESL